MQGLQKHSFLDVHFDPKVLDEDAITHILQEKPVIPPDPLPIDTEGVDSLDDVFAAAIHTIRQKDPKSFDKLLEKNGVSQTDLLDHFKANLQSGKEIELQEKPSWEVRKEGNTFVHYFNGAHAFATSSAQHSNTFDIIMSVITVAFDIAMILVTLCGGSAASAVMDPLLAEEEQALRSSKPVIWAAKAVVRQIKNDLSMFRALRTAFNLGAFFRVTKVLSTLVKTIVDRVAHKMNPWNWVSIGLSLVAGIALAIITAGGSQASKGVVVAIQAGVLVKDIASLIAAAEKN